MPSLFTAQSSTAQNTVLAEMVVMGVIVSVDELSATSPRNGGYIQIWLGTGVATGILVLLSYVLPGFAIGISTAALLSVLLSKGSTFWDVLDKVSNSTVQTQTPIQTQAPESANAASVTAPLPITTVGVGSAEVGAQTSPYIANQTVTIPSA